MKILKTLLAISIIFIVIISYFIGYSNGQSDVYEKAKNSEPLSKLYTGGYGCND